MKKVMKYPCFALSALFVFSLFLAPHLGWGAAEEASKAESTVVYLSDLKPLPASSSFIADKDIEGKPLMLAGEPFKKGLCVNSNSELIYKIGGKYTTFKAIVGPGDVYMEYPGKLTFSVYGDAKKIYESKPLGVKQTEEINVKVEEFGNLSLRVNDDGQHTRAAMWGGASLN
jgi:hypothetical protein